MTRRLDILQEGELIGTLPVPDSFRLPLTDGEIAAIPTMLLGRSRSFLLELREGDLKLERRGEGRTETLVIAAARSLCPGDFGLLAGFEPAAGKEKAYSADQELVDLADEIARGTR